MQLKLNRYDIIATILCTFLALLLVFYNTSKNKVTDKIANVYYENRLVHTFDLKDDKQEFFEINAKLGKIKIEKNNHKVRVVEENSNRHLCSIQGYSDSIVNPIVCLPNNLYIKIVSNDDSDVDVFIK